MYRQVPARGSPWLGAGSFWSPDLQVAQSHGKGTKIYATTPIGGVLRVRNDEELIEALELWGVSAAEERVYDAAWLEEDTFEALQQANISWIVRPVDLNVSTTDVEWIYVGATQLKIEVGHRFRGGPRRR